MSSTLTIEIYGVLDLSQESVELSQMPYKLQELPLTVSVKFNEANILIGSIPQPAPSVLLNYPGVTRRHGRVFFSEDTWYVEAFGSDNGMWLLSNNKRTLAEKGQPLAVSGSSVFLFGTVYVRLIVESS